MENMMELVKRKVFVNSIGIENANWKMYFVLKFCRFHGNTETRKTLEQKFIFQTGTFIQLITTRFSFN